MGPERKLAILGGLSKSFADFGHSLKATFEAEAAETDLLPPAWEVVQKSIESMADVVFQVSENMSRLKDHAEADEGVNPKKVMEMILVSLDECTAAIENAKKAFHVEDPQKQLREPAPFHLPIRRCRVYQTPDYYLLASSLSTRCALVNRIDGSVKNAATAEMRQVMAQKATARIFGVIGIVKLQRTTQLVLISEREQCGVLNGSVIYQVTGVLMLPLGRPEDEPSGEKKKLTEEGREWAERVAKSRLQLLLLTNALQDNLYFSNTLDITNSRQRDVANNPTVPMAVRNDLKFTWNLPALRPFVSQGLFQFATPVICGFVKIKNVVATGDGDLPKSDLRFAVICRRSRFRAGMRYLRRGVDDEGHAANFVETEQIVINENRMSAFVIIRGSIPLVWGHLSGMQYNPETVIASAAVEDEPLEFKSLQSHEIHLDYISKHFQSLFSTYGERVCAVSLIKKVGPERAIGDLFATQIDNMKLPDDQLRYVEWDFAVKGAEKMGELMLLLEGDIELQKMYVSEGERVRGVQRGVFRINCADCLDRTNIVQKFVAQHVLKNQLSAVGVSDDFFAKKDKSVFAFLTSEHLSREPFVGYNEIWADLGDALARQYASSKAMRGDLTRVGRRTMAGVVSDGLASMIRYMNNNFLDSARQEVIDLFLDLGNLSPLEIGGIDLGRRSAELTTHLEQKSEFLKGSGEHLAAIFRGETAEGLTGVWAVLPRGDGTVSGLDQAGSRIPSGHSAAICSGAILGNRFLLVQSDREGDEEQGEARAASGKGNFKIVFEIDLGSLVEIKYGMLRMSGIASPQIASPGLILAFRKSPTESCMCVSEMRDTDREGRHVRVARYVDWDLSVENSLALFEASTDTPMRPFASAPPDFLSVAFLRRFDPTNLGVIGILKDTVKTTTGLIGKYKKSRDRLKPGSNGEGDRGSSDSRQKETDTAPTKESSNTLREPSPEHHSDALIPPEGVEALLGCGKQCCVRRVALLPWEHPLDPRRLSLEELQDSLFRALRRLALVEKSV